MSSLRICPTLGGVTKLFSSILVIKHGKDGSVRISLTKVSITLLLLVPLTYIALYKKSSWKPLLPSSASKQSSS